METVLPDTEYRKTSQLWKDSSIKGRESGAKSSKEFEKTDLQARNNKR